MSCISCSSSSDGGRSSRCVSPPTYSVEIDEAGKLISEKYQVQWPQLPASGTHSKQERKKKMARERKAGSEQLIREFNVAVCPKEQPTPYSVRAMTMERAYSQFEKRQLRHFFIYYQLSSQSFKDVNKIPLELPLMIAYKSDTGNVVHSQIKRFVSKENNNNDNNKDNTELWCAIPYDSNGNPVADKGTS